MRSKGRAVWSCHEQHREEEPWSLCTGRKGLCKAVAKLLAQECTAESPSSAGWTLRVESAPWGLSAENRFWGNYKTFISASSSKRISSSRPLVKDTVAWNRIASQSHGLSSLCDLVSGGLGDSTFCEFCIRKRQNLKMERGDDWNNHWKEKTQRELGVLRTYNCTLCNNYAPRRQRVLLSRGARSPWQGQGSSGRLTSSGSL